MDTIDKWLKSLRLHKYTHLFKELTYEQMLNLEEKYLIEKEVTKGARNKMLVSVKKLNLRQERLINMMDDLNHDNISMKEALTVLKDILVTPIPAPNSTNQRPSPFLDPYELTYLFIETLEEVAQRLIESAGMEDNACHGIMTAVIDECLKHNSFTKEQKAKVASFRQHFAKEQRTKAAGFRQHQLQLRQQRPLNYSHSHHYNHQQQLHQPLQHQFHHNANNHSLPHSNFHSHQHGHVQDHNNHLHSSQLPIHGYQHQKQQQQHRLADHQTSGINGNSNSCIGINSVGIKSNHYHHHHHHNYWNGPIEHQSTSLSASLSTIGSASTSDEEDRHTYEEYSLLGPSRTFELPCLRALAAAEKHSRRQLCFLSATQGKSSC